MEHHQRHFLFRFRRIYRLGRNKIYRSWLFLYRQFDRKPDLHDYL
jgi:hypothetical protein